MEGNVIFILFRSKISRQVRLYRDTPGLEESWREGRLHGRLLLPGTDVELMVEQVSEGGPDAAGPVFLVPSVREIYENNPGKPQFIGEPGETPDGLWLSAPRMIPATESTLRMKASMNPDPICAADTLPSCV